MREMKHLSPQTIDVPSNMYRNPSVDLSTDNPSMYSRKSSRDQGDVIGQGYRKHSSQLGVDTSLTPGRKYSRDQYLSPNRGRTSPMIPDLFVIQDYSAPNSAASSASPAFGFPAGSFLSPDSIDSLYRRSNSTASSIFDLSIESDQLEKALKENNTNAVTKILQVHYGKFPLRFHWPNINDKYSNDSRSRRPSSRASAQDMDLLFPRRAHGHFDRFEQDRRESVTPECDIPEIFRTAIHVAILNKSIEVLKILLMYGLDPNEPSRDALYSERRSSSFHPSGDCLIEEKFENSSIESSSVHEPSPSASLLVQDYSVSTENIRESVDRENFGMNAMKSDTSPNSATKSLLTPVPVIFNEEIILSQDELLRLPPLYTAVTEKNVDATELLLSSGANVHEEDKHGNTPLHISASELYFCQNCCKCLLRQGAKINIRNKQGVTPYNLKRELSDLQKTVVQELLANNYVIYGHGKDSDTLKVANKRKSCSSNSEGSRSFGRSGSLKKKLFKRSEAKEKERVMKERRRNESTSTDMGFHVDFRDFSSGAGSGSYRSSVSVSRHRTHSTAVTEDLDSDVFLHVPIIQQDGSSSDQSSSSTKGVNTDRSSSSGRGIMSRMSLRRGDKNKHRNSCVNDQQDKSAFDETEKSLKALIKMAANPECIPSLIEGLGNYMKLVLTLTDQADTPTIEAAITQLFSQCIQTIYEQLNEKRDSEDKVEHFYDLSRLMIIAFEILKGKQSLHFTALKSINQIIDLCVIHRNHEISCLTKSPEQLSNTELYKHTTPKRKSSQLTSEENTALNRHFSLGRKERRMSHDGHAHSHNKEQHEKSVAEEKEDSKSSTLSNCMQVHRTPLDILSCCDPSQILSILHNNITMHKRIIGTRQKCTPSSRLRDCTHHCLQIMSARVLAVMCHGPSVQHKLVTDGHAKTLVEALDPNHDPHLLCLLLQCLSSVALNPTYHQSLIDADIADMLMQLLLPSDEWYYTNHSTKYAKYVKYHAARILVYLGQLHRLCGRVDLFDTKVFQEAVQLNPIFQGSSVEDTFIEQMALGRIVVWNNKQHIEASSLEGLITHVIEEAVLEDIDKTASPIISLSSSIQSLCVLKSQSDLTTPPVSPACSVQTLIHFSQSSFREFLIMTLPMIIHPVIILRLLAHKMFGNMIRRKNWVAQESKLKPPKEDDLVVEKMCPPRSYSEGKKGFGESKRKKEMLGIEFDASNTPGTFKSALSNNQNGTNLALKAIGESLVTPLELNISACKLKEHKPLSLTQSESPKGSKPKLFKWQSKKHLSKSQVNVSVSEDDSILDKLNLEHSPNHDVDILAFQRELINLPTFVMDTPIDISPVFSRSSSVPDNLASRLNPVASLCQLSAHGSRRRLSKGGHGSEIALSALVPAGSITITKTDVDHHDSSLFFFPPGESTTDTPDESLANIIVHFDPPQSPLLSSASQSPQTFEFPAQSAPVGNHLQPSPAQGNTTTAPSLLPKSTSNELSLSAPPFVKESEGPELKTSLIKADARSPIHSPINDMPAAHKSVIKVLETWIRISRSDLENTAIVVHEMRDFLKKLSALGPEYKLWSQKFTGVLHLEEADVTNQKGEGPDDNVQVQFKELQELILSGDLPCSKEEAATLAGIHLHLDEAWPEGGGANYHGPYPIKDGKMADRGKSVKGTDKDRQENLRKKKELIRNNKARGITLSRRKGRLVKQLSCVSDKDVDTSVDFDISKYLPPLYTHSKKVKQLIEEKQKKLWHTPFYDSEIQLKRLYIKICKNLPGYGCKLYHVKELLKGNTQKKVSRLLGISSEKVILLDNKTKLLAKSQNISELDEWRTGSGKCHDGLVLEFRGTKTWTLSMLSPDSLKSVTAVLWDALDMHTRFLNSSTLRRESFEFDFQRKQLTLSPDAEGSSRYTKELEGLQKLLQFPEEVAVLLTDTESRLFNQVPAADYIRQVTIDISRGTTINAKVTGVEDLIHRFNEVSTWITQLIITQPTHDNRKAVLSCILRLAHYCWCIGNFNSSMEILAGLKSEKLKPFWLLLSNEDLSTFHNLSNALFSREQTTEYRDAVSAALDIKECKVIPFFGGFLKDLRYNLMCSPSIVVLPSDADHSMEFISDYCGQDRFLTRIGVGGLINMEKLKKANSILTDIQLFQYHSSFLLSDSNDAGLHLDTWDEKPPYDNFTTITVDSDSELDFDSYQPIKQLSKGQEVMIITPRFAQLDHQCLQIMNHGSTLIHIEDESGRSCMSFVKLESDNSTLTWKKPNWSALRSNSLTIPDYVLRGDFDYSSIQAMYTRYCSGEVVYDTLEEGYLDVTLVKDVCYADEDSVDLAPVSKRYGLENITARSNCICLIYGSSIAENKKLYFAGPRGMIKTWYHGLCKLCHAAYRLRRQIDKRIQWLKIQYLQLYYENEKCLGPTPAEAITVFGGRRWTPGGPQLSTNLPDSTSSFKRTSSFVMGSNIFKKKSSGPLQSGKEPSPKSSQAGSGQGKKTKRSPSPQTRNKQTVSQAAVNTDSISDTQITLQTPKLSTIRSQSQPCTNSFLTRYRHRRRTSSLGKTLSDDNKNSSITHSSNLTFLDFLDLFRAFMLRSRKDLRGLFEQFAITKPSQGRLGRKSVHSMTSESSILTRNGAYDLHHSNDASYLQRRKICDAIAVSSIFENCAGVDTAQNRYLGLKEFREFLEDYQEEHLDDQDIIALIHRHEPDSHLRENCFLSFEGFAKYLMDKDNYAYIYEKTKHNDEDMDHPLPHYYIASSHNTYLTSHQLKGDSCVEMYSQILLAGCRCVELDCWDGDDGLPVIYHGHTLTTKISFKAVVETINRSAFVTSPYPVILSLENHCSIPQQQKMAHIFQSVFGEKLVSQFLFDTDFTDDPTLPSPNQFKYKILIKNKKIVEDGETHLTAKKVSPFSRNYSMVLSEGSTSHEYDFEDDDDDEEDDITDDDKKRASISVTTVKDSRRSMDSQESRTSPDQDNTLHTAGSCGDLSRSASCTFNDKLRPKSHPELDWQFDDDVSESTRQTKQKQKKASQIAQELSDLVVYLQAVKFRGLNVSPNSSLKQKYTKPIGSKKTPSGTPPSISDRGDSSSVSTNISLRQKRPDSTPSCYIVSSLNENKAKHMCRRNPNLVINEKQLLRTYPAGTRIDSSNFNPVIFWAHGIQMVALNYQTEDTAMALNTAMFEQNGQSGYVLKPAVKWDKSHVMYNHFNPWEKEFDGLHTTVLTLHVISGQYVCNNFSASTQVEVEIIGIPVDCAKHKTRVIPRNSLNPIWNDVFTFQVMYCELAFIRFMVIDTVTSHIVSQRVIPLQCVRPGYRHVRLRNLNNQPLELASIFIYSKHEEELLEPCGRHEYSHDSTSAILKSVFTRVKDLSDKDGKDIHIVSPVGTKLKRRMFFISVFGVTAPDEYVILKVTQDTSVIDAIAQALMKAGKVDEKVADYVLVEDVQNSWEKREQERTSSQRILNMSEKVLQAQNKWKGAGTFVLRKVSTDPSSRAWVTTMMSKEQKRQTDGSATSGDWDRDEHMFLVCVYNVSPDQPYTIFKAPTTSTAQDIITQAMMKAHRSEEVDPRNFLLLEELDLSGESYTSVSKKRDSEKLFRRILASDENVYHSQSEWKTNGRFVLVDRDMVQLEQDLPSDKKKKSSVQIKGDLFQTASRSTSLARKFCAKLGKTSTRERTPSTDDASVDGTAGEYTASSSTLTLPLSSEKILLEPPPTPPASSSDVQSSKKWKRILKLGKT